MHFTKQVALDDFFIEAAVRASWIVEDAMNMGELHLIRQLTGGGTRTDINTTYFGKLMRLCSEPGE